MDLKDHAIRLAAEQGCTLDWRAVTEAASYNPDEVIDALDTAATVAARQLIRAVLVEAATDLRTRLAGYDLDAGVDQVAADLIRVCAAYQTAGEELTESRVEFLTAARRIVGTA